MNSPRLLSRVLAPLALAAVLAAPVQAGLLETSSALDRVYIPALALSTAAQTDTAARSRAPAALQKLQANWPALRAELLQGLSIGAAGRAASARRTLARADAHIAAAVKAMAVSDFKAAHEALEAVRVDLMVARSTRGVDYFVDRLTAFHEPMEVLALAGKDWSPQALTPPRREELARAFAHARALWQAIELNPPDPAAYGLDSARAAQLRQATAEESQALSRLSDALRGSDAAALLKAAAAIKPPFARVFTAFGQAG